MANYLTGNKTIAPRPSIGINLCLYNFYINGTKYAKVFPEPVLDDTNKSLSASACGIEHLCTYVILVKPLLFNPLIDCFDIGKSE